jgi:hypothetical protein
MNSYEISFPGPLLNPNSTKHWSKKAKAKASHRMESKTLARSARPIVPDTDIIRVHLDFYPPDHRKRDRDNMRASMKAALDGLADALGVDDVRFDPTYTHHAPIKPGKVVITVGPPS